MQCSIVADLARRHGFGSIAEGLAEVAAWGARIAAAPGQEVPGGSRLGGRPDLRPSTPWPDAPAGEPMGFVAQIRLADVASLGWGGPENGLLSFFIAYDDDGFPLWGPGAAAVIHEPADGTTPRDHPGGAPGDASLAWTFTPELCLPWAGTGPSLALAPFSLNLSDLAVAERYAALCHALADHQGLPAPASGGPAIWEVDRFAGHSASLQGDPIEDCAALVGDANAVAWRDLLQLTDTDDDGEQIASYFCAPADAGGTPDLAAAQATHHHG